MLSIDSLNAAIRNVAAQLSPRAVQHGWRQMSEHALWAELVSCILGSATTYEMAKRACDALAVDGCLRVADNKSSEMRTGRVLKTVGYRFPGSRAKQIARSAEFVYADAGGLHAFLERCGGRDEARKIIVANIHGLGPKQASLFLRNVDYSDDVAILDTHVLRYMRFRGATECVAAPTSLRAYAKCENEFKDISDDLGLDIAVADIATWVVMRVVSKEPTWRS